MKYRVYGETLPAVSFLLEPGERIRTQAGSMAWMTSGIRMDANMTGGVRSGIGRMLAGESLFLVDYLAQESGQELTVSSSFPGMIVPLQLDGSVEYVCQRQAFLCATEGVTLSMESQFNLGGLFGGEGLIMQRLSGKGMAFVELDGHIVERTLNVGETMKVSTGNLALYESTVRYDVETVKGAKNIFFGGEGLFLSTLQGPGKIWLQTINLARFAGKLTPYISN